MVVTGKKLSGLDISLDLSECTVLDKPLGLGRVNLDEVVIEPLIEGHDVGKVLEEGLNSSRKDSSNASKLLLSTSLCPLIGLLY